MSSKQIFFAILIILGSIIGLLDTGYLSLLEWQGKNSLACDVGGFNCNAVLTSQYSRFLGIPLAYCGLAYYLGLFVLAVIYLDLRHKKILQTIEFTLWVGFSISLVLLYLQAFTLKAFCLYCLVSEAAIFSMVLGFLIIKFVIKKTEG